MSSATHAQPELELKLQKRAYPATNLKSERTLIPTNFYADELIRGEPQIEKWKMNYDARVWVRPRTTTRVELIRGYTGTKLSGLQQTLVRLLWSSMSSNVTFLSLWWRGKKAKKTQKQSRENDYACSKVENLTQLRLFIHQSAWCVGRNFCGYLILRFFPNRKNSQNIVPANNSNNKVAYFPPNCYPLIALLQ